ncbi:Gfo/Idh/MocA family oxidoreductase [Actinomyces radicidentis]|uniref:Gfo/Idh/MocA family protein n=1 Tax=Actinomyces radicidentis TaxID=111015 RepID=UPI0028E39439|nr:Gfo/Idh/MocA family oxidoreductase [Actinomyces radicidentis]
MTSTSPSPETAPVRFGVIGAGFIARWFLEAVAVLPQAEVVAVTSAHADRAAAFAAEHGIGASYGSLPEMLAAGTPDGATSFDVVYVGSPNALHAEQTVAALEAGFHVLVEKPFALRADEAEAMVASARRAGRFLMEGWLPAFEPGTAAVREALPRLSTGEAGPHRALLVKEQYSSRMDRFRAGELPPAFDPSLGGGSLMDLGVYPVSMAIHLFGRPARVRATGRLLRSGADSHGTVVLEYDRLPDGTPTDLEVVCLHSKTSTNGTLSEVAADRAVLTLDDCQWPREVRLVTPDGVEDLAVDAAWPAGAVVPAGAGDPPVLARELAEVCRLVRSGERESGLQPLSASLASVRVLEEARAQVGVRFPGDAGATMGA